VGNTFTVYSYFQETDISLEIKYKTRF